MGWQDDRNPKPGAAPGPGERRPVPPGGFGHGGPWAGLAPSAGLAVALEAVAGPDDLYDGADTDALTGIVSRWAALESWAAAGKLAALRAMMREDRDGTPRLRRRPGLPDGWDDSLSYEVAQALAMGPVSADNLALLAWTLSTRLPGTGRLLADGTLTMAKAKLIAAVFELLDEGEAARAEALILGEVPGKTYFQVERLAWRAALAVAPDVAERRRRKAERERARVTVFREESGAVGLSGRDLPAAQALAGHASVLTRAREYEVSGAFPGQRLSALQALAFLHLLNGVSAADAIAFARTAAAEPPDRERPDGGTGQDGQPGEDGEDPRDEEDEDSRGAAGTPAGPAGGGSRTGGQEPDGGGGNPEDGQDPGGHDPGGRDPGGGPGPRGPASTPAGLTDGGRSRGSSHGPDGQDPDGGEDRSDRQRPDDEDPGSDENPGGGPGPDGGDGPAPAGDPAALPEVTVPLATLQRLAARAGENRLLGPLDPVMARDIAAAAARSPRSRWEITVVDEHGYAAGHGIARPRRDSRQQPQPPPHPPGTAGCALPARINISVTQARLRQLAAQQAQQAQPRSGAPPGGWDLAPRTTDTWTLTLPGGLELTVRFDAVPTHDCDHAHEVDSYQPSQRLRRLVQVRDRECTFPPCSRPAHESDFEHAVPYDQGGRTGACNAGARSRRCHQVKQSPGWTVTQPKPGWHVWTTPTGRTYVQEPWRYIA